MQPKVSQREADYEPLCPHCDQPIREVHWRQLQAVNAEYLFACPHCRKVLGIGVRKAAWIN